MPTKAKPSNRVKSGARRSRSKLGTPVRSLRRKSKPSYAKPYDAKKYAGSVPAFANMTAEEMKSWRDDR